MQRPFIVGAMILLVCSFGFAPASEDGVTPAHPYALSPAFVRIHLDAGCVYQSGRPPFGNSHAFNVVIRDTSDNFVAVGSGSATDGIADIIADLSEFENGLPDGVYNLWTGDEDPEERDIGEETFAFSFVVFKGALIDGGITEDGGITFDAVPSSAIQWIGSTTMKVRLRPAWFVETHFTFLARFCHSPSIRKMIGGSVMTPQPAF